MVRGWLLLAVIATGCARDPRPAAARTGAASESASETVFLGEWLALDAGRCRVADARSVLTELREQPGQGRASPDLHAVELSLACEDTAGRARPLDQVLPDSSVLTLRGADGAIRAPSLRTKLSARTPDALVFEVAEESEILQRPRRYDARSGASSGSRERAVGTLRISGPDGLREIVLRERLRDAVLDRWLDAFARAMSAQSAPPAGAPEAIGDARSLYAEVMERFDPAYLTLAGVQATPSGLTATLILERPRIPVASSPVASFRLGLAREHAAGTEQLSVVELLDAEDAREALACSDASNELVARVERSTRRPRTPAAQCNVLGQLLPGACQELEPALLEAALSLGSRCGAGAHIDPPPANARLPDDFQLTLRRGRGHASLDHAPRYVVSIYANGNVVFHGRHWVTSTTRSDGRTTTALVRLLFAHLTELGWFERRGGRWNPEACDLDSDSGDVFTVHAAKRERMLLDREGCRGPFTAPELAELARLVEAVAGVSGWTRPGASVLDTGLTEWVVSPD